ncbi:hypothetical protein SLS58_007807 [Diplodia intermedia]|uniref:tyrosinase n=1 Tax=Diplodia intermedia TaxID=856260 RepID=A0ABR3TJ79_9PEZI
MTSLAYAQAYGVVVGLKSASDVQPRREIDDLVVNEPDMFNLFLLALEALQKDYGGWQDKMSYFQIAGIHGLPKQEWDNVRGDTDKIGGYCTHDSILFPTWHRPYLAMMEQTIYNTMEQLAAQFDDPKYRIAAKKFRLPYWDYFHPREQKTTVFPGIGPGGKTSFPYDFRLPSVLKEPQLMVYRPKTQEPNDETYAVPMDNPLKTFVFPTKGSIPPSEWALMEATEAAGKAPGTSFTVAQTHTVRHARPGSNAVDDFAALDLVLNRDREAELRIMLDLIESAPYADYRNFATSALSDAPNATSGSLEDLHGSYHVNVGGAGHMSRVPVAAFDPVFWLHHCNIDRLLTIWLALHTDFIPDRSVGTDRAGTPLPTATTNLYPFRRAIVNGQVQFWTSADARDTRSFGYTYPDLHHLEQTSGSKDRNAILTEFDQNYRWALQRAPARRQEGCGGGQGQQGGFGNIPKAMQPRDVRGAQCFNYSGSSLAVRVVEAPRRVEEMQVAGYGGAQKSGYGAVTPKPDYEGAGYGGGGGAVEKKRDSAYGGSTSSAWGSSTSASASASSRKMEWSESSSTSAYGSSAWGSSSYGGNTPRTEYTGGGGGSAYGGGSNKPGSYNEPQNKGFDGGAPRVGGYGGSGTSQTGGSYGSNYSAQQNQQQQQQQQTSNWGSSSASDHQRQTSSGYGSSQHEHQISGYSRNSEQTSNSYNTSSSSENKSSSWGATGSNTANLTTTPAINTIHCTSCGNKNIHCTSCGSTSIHCTTCASSKPQQPPPQNKPSGYNPSVPSAYADPQNKGFNPDAHQIGGGLDANSGAVRKTGDYGSGKPPQPGSYDTTTSAYHQQASSSSSTYAAHQRSSSWGSSEYKAGSNWDSPLQKIGYGGGGGGYENQNKGFQGYTGEFQNKGFDGGGAAAGHQSGGWGSSGEFQNQGFQGGSYAGAEESQNKGFDGGAAGHGYQTGGGGYGSGSGEPQNKGFEPGAYQPGGWGGESQNQGFDGGAYQTGGAYGESQNKSFDGGEQQTYVGASAPQDRGLDVGEVQKPVLYSRAPQGGHGGHGGHGGRGQHEKRECEKRPQEKKDCNKHCDKCGSQEHRSDNCNKPAHEHKSCHKCGGKDHRPEACNKPAHENSGCHKCGGKDHRPESCNKPSHENKSCHKCGSRDHRPEACNKPTHENKGCHKCGGRDHHPDSCNKPSHENKSCNKCGSRDHHTEGCGTNVPPQPVPGHPGSTSNCTKCGSNTHGTETCGTNVPPQPVPGHPGSTSNCTKCGSNTHGPETCGTNVPQPGSCPPGNTTHCGKCGSKDHHTEGCCNTAPQPGPHGPGNTTCCTKCGSSAHRTETCGGATASQPGGWNAGATSHCTHCGSNTHHTSTCSSSGEHSYGGQTGGGQTGGGGFNSTTHCTSCGAQQNRDFDDGARCTSCGCLKLQIIGGNGYQPGGRGAHQPGGGNGYQPGGSRAYHTGEHNNSGQHGWTGGFENAGHQIDTFNNNNNNNNNNSVGVSGTNHGWTPGFENAGLQPSSSFDGSPRYGGNTHPQHGPEHVPSFRKGEEILRAEPPGSRLVLNWYIDTEVNK